MAQHHELFVCPDCGSRLKLEKAPVERVYTGKKVTVLNVPHSVCIGANNSKLPEPCEYRTVVPTTQVSRNIDELVKKTVSRGEDVIDYSEAG